MKKVIFIVCDGLGDRPIKALKGKTPLEAALTPNLDKLAQGGISGVMNSVEIGIKPGSDTSHLAILGYDPNVYYTGRGPFETAGIGMEVQKGDVAFRVNMSTVDENLKVIDRRAGRIDNTSEHANLLNKTEINGITFILKSSVGHRVGMIMRGKGLSDKITDGDPHSLGEHIHNVQKIKPLNSSKEAKFTADVLNKFLDISYKKLKNLKSNDERVKNGKLPANYFLVRGAGIYPNMPSFKEKYGLNAACYAGGSLYKGIAKTMGMNIIDLPKEATGKPNSSLITKVKALNENYQKYDFHFVHFKGTDTLGEDGNYKGKKEFIEKQIDPAIGEIIKLKESLIVVTADHSTPCSLKSHSADDVPITFKGEDIRDDDVEHFNEKECAKGRLGHIKGSHVMPIIIDLMGLASLFGA